MLSGCPDGATSDALATVHNFDHRLKADLLCMNYVSMSQYDVDGQGRGRPPIPVACLFITALGRDYLRAIKNGARCTAISCGACNEAR
jgi:hypothetical protein